MKKFSFVKIVLLVLMYAITLILSGCDYIHHDSKIDKINLLDLLFEASDMPSHWTVVNYGINKAIGLYRSSDGAGIVFLSDLYPESLGVDEEIYRFDTIARSKGDYVHEFNILVQPSSFVPSEWKFYSQTADQSYFGCIPAPNFTSCTWLARYKSIVVEARCILIPDRFTVENMEKIVKVIDDKVSGIIGESN